MFETPFTRRGPDGKVSHGDVSCQWKVKTILTTEACFPYLKTRIKVVAREDLELKPIQVLAWLRDCLGWVTSRLDVDQHIQVSIEDLERKLEKLETACGPPVNLIMLQVPLVQ